MSAHAIGRPTPGQDGGAIPPRAFAALPHDLAGDPRINPVGKSILLALLFWARGKPSCWPSDASIGRRVGRSVATVQRALRALEGLGVIVREKSDANRTGRLIVLSWRADDRPPRSPMIDPPASQVIDKGDVIVKGDSPKEKPAETKPVERRRPETRSAPVPIATVAPGPAPIPIPSDPGRTFVATLDAGQLARLDAMSPGKRRQILEHAERAGLAAFPVLLAELERARPVAAPPPLPETTAALLAALPGAPADWPAKAATLLALDFGSAKDQALWPEFERICHAAWRGAFPVADLVDAHRQATGPKATNRGAVFAVAIKRHGWRS